jgi:ATP-binding cassette subfamily C protein CydC
MFSRLTGDLDALDGILIRFAIPVVAGATILIGTALLLATVDLPLALAATAPIALCGIVAPLALGTRAGRHARLKFYALDAARVRMADLDRGRAEFAASGRLSARIEAVRNAFERSAAADLGLAKLDAVLRFISVAGSHVAVACTVAAAIPLLRSGDMTPTGFVAVALFAMALGEIVAPLRAVAFEYGRWALAARRTVSLIPDDARETRGLTPPSTTGRSGTGITLGRIAVAEGEARRPRLCDVSLVVQAGERVALVGPSGGGKSTLIGVLAGQIRPSSGAISFEPKPSVGPAIAWLGQRTELFRGTVAQNLRLGRPEATDHELRTVLNASELWDALGADALARSLGDGGSGLSGGERRRLALARLMVLKPDLILVDEPTEGLDEETARSVFDALLNWADGRTLVYATHRTFEAAAADTVVRILDGRVVEVVRQSPAVAPSRGDASG